MSTNTRKKAADFSAGSIRFKPYDQDLQINIGVLASDFIKENALVRIIDEIVERIDMKDLEVFYSRYGSPAYHPKMLIKVWAYGYCEKVYTSRPLAKKLRSDLGFMWLAGGQTPDFKTLSDFRSVRMQGLIDVVFRTVLGYLVEAGYVDLEDLYIDGSKWQANANKYKRVWRKNMERYKANVLFRIEELLKEYRALQEAEDARYGSKDLKGHQEEAEIQVVLKSSDLQSAISRMGEAIASSTEEVRQKKLKKLQNELHKEVPKLMKYEEQEVILAGRNSYSKTDEDATMLRMKDEQLLPGYNVELTTSKQYAIAGSIHQSSSDSATLPEHWAALKANVSGLVKGDWLPDVTADAGYGSEENYDLLRAEGANSFVKYPFWYKEKTGQLAKRTFYFINWVYEESGDFYRCPNNRKLVFRQLQVEKSQNGYERTLRVYECESCRDCPFSKDCRGEKARTDMNRTIRFSPNLETHKAGVKARLDSDRGKEKRAQRGVDVETPFGDLKHNQGHRRFILRGIEKVRVELLLLLIAHNFRKLECEITGKWKEYYAQRATKKQQKGAKRA